MRIRSIKPEFHSSFTIALLSEPAVILAVGLLNHADDAGYFEADPRIIKANIFPLREPSRSITGCLTELCRIEFIALRTAPNGRLVGHVLNFLRHQVINKPAKRQSKAQVDYDKGAAALEFAHPSANADLPLLGGSGSVPVVLPEYSEKKPAGTGNREQGKGTGFSSEPSASPEAPSSGQPASDEALKFPCIGDPAEWILTHKQVADWQQTFVGVSVAAECRVALEWCNANSAKKKTARGMPRFLFAWLERCQNRGGSSPMRTAAVGTVKPATVWELQQREKAILDRIRAFTEGHEGQRYVGMQPGSNSPYEWTQEGQRQHEKLKSDLGEVRRQLATLPGEAGAA